MTRPASQAAGRGGWLKVARTNAKAPPRLAVVRKAPVLSEARFQAQVVTLARLKGWFCFHVLNSRGSAAGFPDLLVLRNDRCFFAELKKETGKISQPQAIFIARLREAGQIVYVWRPSDWPTVLEVLN